MIEENKGNRRSIRLQAYDYSEAGMYYITICTKDKAFLFGNIQEGNMITSNRGKIVEATLLNISKRFPQVLLDEYIIMPNHIHFIIQIVGAIPCGRPPTLGKIIGAFKSESVYNYLQYIKKYSLKESCLLWQRNYYEHVIRNDEDLERIREYIQMNPLQWKQDSENPENIKKEQGRPQGIAPTKL